MSEFTVVLVGVVALCLLVSLVFARKTPPAVEIFDSRPVAYSITVWAEKSDRVDPQQPINEVRPQKITAEYSVCLQADSAVELSAAQQESARWALANFRRHFAPMLGEINIGAVHCEPEEEKE